MKSVTILLAGISIYLFFIENVVGTTKPVATNSSVSVTIMSGSGGNVSTYNATIDSNTGGKTSGGASASGNIPSVSVTVIPTSHSKTDGSLGVNNGGNTYSVGNIYSSSAFSGGNTDYRLSVTQYFSVIGIIISVVCATTIIKQT